MTRIRRGRLLGLVLLALPALLTVPLPAVGAGELQLPNLVPLPRYEIHVGPLDEHAYRTTGALRFTVAVANRGEHALDLTGLPTADLSAVAHQCVSWAAPRVCIARAPAGRFVWHAPHAHYHFEEFALYELRRLLPDGTPDMTPGGLVASGGKASFCLLDGEPDRAASHPLYELPHPLYYSCLAGVTQQGISPGWRDVYTYSLAGQQIPLRGVPNGTYAVVVTTDPSHRLAETTRRDNVASALVRILRVGGGRARCREEDGLTECAL